MKHLALQPVLFLFLIALTSCNNSSQPTVGQPTPVTGAAKRYHLTGKVVSVDKQAHMLNIDGQEIPGFMSAMTMPYNVKPEGELDSLSQGDSITADIVIQGDSSWLENVKVTAHGAPSPK